MLWKFNPNQERSALFDAVWKQYVKNFADPSHIIQAAEIQAFCTQLAEATLRLVFAAEKAADKLSPEERGSILKTVNVMSEFHSNYHSTEEHISDQQHLREALSSLGDQMAEGIRLGWEYKLSGKFPQPNPEVVFEKNHARNGHRPR